MKIYGYSRKHRGVIGLFSYVTIAMVIRAIVAVEMEDSWDFAVKAVMVEHRCSRNSQVHDNVPPACSISLVLDPGGEEALRLWELVKSIPVPAHSASVP